MSLKVIKVNKKKKTITLDNCSYTVNKEYIQFDIWKEDLVPYEELLLGLTDMTEEELKAYLKNKTSK